MAFRCRFMLNLEASAALPRLSRIHATGSRIPDICELLGQIAFESPTKQLGALVDSLGHVDLMGAGVQCVGSGQLRNIFRCSWPCHMLCRVRRVWQSIGQEVFRQAQRRFKARQGNSAPPRDSGAGDDVRSPGAVFRALVQGCTVPPASRHPANRGIKMVKPCRTGLKVLFFE